MPLFQTQIINSTIPDLTSEQAQIIYTNFKNNKNYTTQFIEHNVPIEHSKQVWTEITRLETIIMNYVYNDEETHSESEVLALLSSDILNINILLNDCIIYNPTYQEGMTFDEFVNTCQAQNNLEIV